MIPKKVEAIGAYSISFAPAGSRRMVLSASALGNVEQDLEVL
jgi:hypothetical protein